MGDTDDSYDGGLFTLDEWPIGNGFEIDDLSYDGIAVDACDLNDETTACRTFEPLMDAGRLYLQLELVNLAFLFQWGAFIFHAVVFKRDWAHPVLVYALPHLAWIMHLMAVISWTAVSEVEFEVSDCSNDDTEWDEALDVCIRSGPVMSIV